MLTKIFYLLCSLGPGILNSMATEKNFHQEEAETAVNNKMEFQSFGETVAEIIEKTKYQNWKCIGPIWRSFPHDWN